MLGASEMLLPVCLASEADMYIAPASLAEASTVSVELFVGLALVLGNVHQESSVSESRRFYAREKYLRGASTSFFFLFALVWHAMVDPSVG